MIYNCCSEIRRNAVKAHATLNGIDFLEVDDNVLYPEELRQTTLFVHFIKPIIAGNLHKTNFTITGGERIKGIKVTDVKTPVVASPLTPDPRILQLKVDKAGDFSGYKLNVVLDEDHPEPPANFDNILSSVDFSFKVLCDSPFDCEQDTSCEKLPVVTPDINYLAKDYASFRQLMLDRMALLVPGWTERNAADPGVAIIEMLAYVGDYLSYQQDAIATEAYLNTCRKRISLRRHARLIDYFINDGSNARAWVQISVSDVLNGYELKKNTGTGTTKFMARIPDLPAFVAANSTQFDQAVYNGAQVFELMHNITLHSAHNSINFYTWGEEECCIPKGATSAMLAGDYPDLAPGDILILAEVLGAKTGVAGDADPAKRHPIRITKVAYTQDLLFDGAQPVTEINWNALDALPFSLCVSARVGSSYFSNVSVAMGNIVLADHGLTYRDDAESSLYPQRVPLARIATTGGQADRCKHEDAELILPRYCPHLKQRLLTFAMEYNEADHTSAATRLTGALSGTAKPQIILNEFQDPDVPVVTAEWFPQQDLLESNPDAKEFVVEMEADGIAHIRFGDGVLGARPSSGSVFNATYRVGNGTVGNIGADVLAHIVTDDAGIKNNPAAILKVTNLLPATGGADPETMDEVRLKAPKTFKVQERAVLPADYEEMAHRVMPDIQRAASTSRWTGSWRTNFISVDRMGGYDVDEAYETELRNGFERYRMAGIDIEVDGPVYVSLDIQVAVCIEDSYFPADVKADLLKLFSNKTLPNGSKGIFHPDNFTFGQTVYLSSIYAAAQTVPGVLSVNVTRFQRQGEPLTDGLDSGKILINRLEIARLDNNPDFRERGVIEVSVISRKK